MRLFFWLVCFCFLSCPIFSAIEINPEKLFHTTIPTSHFANLLPERELGFMAKERDTALTLFQYAGRNIDDDPQRSKVCKQAFGRFINTFLNYPLSDLLYCMQTGLSLSPRSQMDDFYITGIGRIYVEALHRYYPNQKESVYESMRGLFSVIYDIPDYKALMNTVLAGLLKKECITPAIADKLLNQHLAGGHHIHTGPKWLNKENEDKLLSVQIKGSQG